MIEAVLWDNDGVLVDSERRFFELSRQAFARVGLDLSEAIWRELYLGKGVGSRQIALALGGEAALIDPQLDERNRQYLEILQDPPAVRPFIPDTLAALNGRTRLALVTGCHRRQLDLMHRTSGLLDLFEVIVTGDDAERSKPDPEPYRLALERLGLAADCCLAVEDSTRGLHSALAAGVACVVIPTDLTAGQDFSGALALERDAAGILKYLQLSGPPGSRQGNDAPVPAQRRPT